MVWQAIQCLPEMCIEVIADSLCLIAGEVHIFAVSVSVTETHAKGLI